MYLYDFVQYDLSIIHGITLDVENKNKMNSKYLNCSRLATEMEINIIERLLKAARYDDLKVKKIISRLLISPCYSLTS